VRRDFRKFFGKKTGKYSENEFIGEGGTVGLYYTLGYLISRMRRVCYASSNHTESESSFSQKNITFDKDAVVIYTEIIIAYN